MQFPNQKLLWYANNALFQKNLKMNRNLMKTVAKGKMKENQILKLYTLSYVKSTKWKGKENQFIHCKIFIWEFQFSSIFYFQKE
jgi:hypothetical protein